METFIKLKSELIAPKGQFNSFGKYNYRSAEDILEAVKPLLTAHNLSLCVSDEVVLIGARYYIKAMATIRDETFKIVEYASAYAREAENKKGMDEAQITGSASSYARKYALNGLFCIDDTKDADSTNQHGKAPTKTKQAPASKPHPIAKQPLNSAQAEVILRRFLNDGELDIFDKAEAACIIPPGIKADFELAKQGQHPYQQDDDVDKFNLLMDAKTKSDNDPNMEGEK